MRCPDKGDCQPRICPSWLSWMLTPVSWTTLLAMPALLATTPRFNPGFQSTFKVLYFPQL